MKQLALLAQEVGVNERTLRRAINEGTLRASRPTPRSLDLTVSEQRYISGHWHSIATIRKLLRTEPNVRFAMLVGSYAAGTDSPSSDIDVVVEMTDESSIRSNALERKLEDELKRDVDVIAMSDATRDPALFANFLDGARVIVDRDGTWTRLQEDAARIQMRAKRHMAKLRKSAFDVAEAFLQNAA